MALSGKLFTNLLIDFESICPSPNTTSLSPSSSSRSPFSSNSKSSSGSESSMFSNSFAAESVGVFFLDLVEFFVSSPDFSEMLSSSSALTISASLIFALFASVSFSVIDILIWSEWDRSFSVSASFTETLSWTWAVPLPSEECERSFSGVSLSLVSCSFSDPFRSCCE